MSKLSAGGKSLFVGQFDSIFEYTNIVQLQGIFEYSNFIHIHWGLYPRPYASHCVVWTIALGQNQNSLGAGNTNDPTAWR